MEGATRRPRFQRLFNLRAGEGRRAGFFAVLAFLWGLGGFGGFTLSEGLFVEHVGTEGLPAAYALIALSMCLLSSLLVYALGRLSVERLLVWMISGTVASIFTLYLLYTLTEAPNQIPFWYAFKTVSWITPIAINICFWSFVDQYFDLQDAKRFFCLFNSMIFLGDGCGGAVIHLGLERLGVGPLILIFAGSIATSLPCIFLISSRLKPGWGESWEGADRREEKSFRKIIQGVKGSRFTLYLLLFYLAMQLVAVVTEFHYLETLEGVFEGRDSALTKFLGTCGMWIAFGNMLFGLLFYSRLVEKMGVNNIIMIAPLFFAVLAVFWLGIEALPLAIFGMIGREGMVYTFDDNNLNLLITGVPQKIKNQVRVAVESFFEPIGMFLCAFLLFLVRGQASWLGVVLSAVAVALVLGLRAHYSKAIFRNLVARSIRFEKKATDWLTSLSSREKRKIEFRLLVHLKKGDEATQLLAFEYLLKMGNGRYLPHLLNLFGQLSIPGKLRALELLGESPFAEENVVLERLERWRSTLPHPSFKSAIHFYFAQHGLLAPKRIEHDLKSEHLGLRGAAILALLTHGSGEEELHRLLNASDERELCMGIRLLGLKGDPESIVDLFPFLSHHSPRVRRKSAHALARVASPSWKPYTTRLIEHLRVAQEASVRCHLLEAISKCDDPSCVHPLVMASLHFRPSELKEVEKIVLRFGKEPLPTLLTLTLDVSLPTRCRLLAGKIVSQLSLPTLRSEMPTLVKQESKRALFYFYHAHSMQKQTPEHDLSLLQDALLSTYHATLDFLIQLIGVAGALEESEVLSHTLSSKNRKIHSQAFETLEKTCDPKLFSYVKPLIDHTHPEQKLRNYLRKGGTPYTLAQLLEFMSTSPSLSEQIVSLTLKARLNTPNWKAAVREKLDREENIFHHFAHELL